MDPSEYPEVIHPQEPEPNQYNITLRDSEGNEKSFVYSDEFGLDILRASFSRDVEIEKENQQAVESEEENPVIQEKLNLPHSCVSGVCGSCLGKVVEGQIEQNDSGSCLDSSKHDDGYYLLCRSKPTSDCVIETHKKSDLYV